MQITKERLQELKKLLARDYGVELSDAEAEQLGLSMLRVYRLASTALARAEEQSSVRARESTFLESRTSG